MQVITNPDKFFARLVREDVNIRRPLVIVLILAIIVSLYQYLFILKITEALPAELARFSVIGVYIGAAISFIFVFAKWFLIAIIMHAISALFDGSGSFRRTFEFTGYGFLPSLVGSVIMVPMSLYYISQAKIPKISLQQLQQNPQIMKSVILLIIPKNLIYSNLIINIAITIWSLTIWTFAIKHAREIELRKAFITALIPTFLFAIYQVWNLLKIL